jgi:hypothetical protein
VDLWLLIRIISNQLLIRIVILNDANVL